MMFHQKGQVAVEFILISIFIVSLALGIGRYLRESAFLERFAGGPWALLTGMIESGVWERPQVAKTMHPNYLKRHVTFKGDEE